MRTTRRDFFTLAGVFVAGALGARPAQAQAPKWPQRNVRLIVPLGAGSGVDIGSRLLADRLSQRWGQSVIV